MMKRHAMSNVGPDPLKVAAKVEEIFGEDLHAMRVLSLANGVVGVLDAATVFPVGRLTLPGTGNPLRIG
jgi:hypothetical protein